MNRKTIVTIVSIAAVLHFRPINLQAQAPSIRPLGLLPGGHYPAPTALSGDGSTIVGTGILPSGGEQAFRWTQANGYEMLGYLPTGARSRAAAVSFDGRTVVGNASVDHLGWQTDKAVWWEAQDTTPRRIDFGINDDWATSSAYDVCPNGRIVGRHERFPWNFDGFVWDQSTGLQFLSPPHEVYSDVRPTVISDDCQSVFDVYGLTWSEPFASPPTHVSGFGWFIDAGPPGLALGHEYNGSHVPMIWTATGGPEVLFESSNPDFDDLGIVPHLGRAISADGNTIVGLKVVGIQPEDADSWLPDAHFGPMGGSVDHNVLAPFVWTRSGDYQWLDEFLINHGVDLTGWTLYTAMDVSPDGRTIIGDGFYNGTSQPFVATIPEPSSAAFIALLAIFAQSRRRRPRCQKGLQPEFNCPCVQPDKI